MVGELLIEPLTDAEFELLRRLVYEVSGIHLSDQKKALLSNRLRRRVRELGLPGYRAYYDLLQGRGEGAALEREQFLSAITTNETYFFRNDKLWDFVRDELCPLFAARSNEPATQRRIRFWSAASSTGEEAYTFAILLREHLPQLSRMRLEILATDLSQGVLQRARAGVYSEYSLNKVPPGLRRRYWQAVDGGWKLADDVRRMVEFRQHNLRDPMPRKFDVVFLRNVMIYFDLEMKKRVMREIMQTLEDGAYLVIGDVDPLRHGDGLLGCCAGLRYVQPTIYRYSREALHS